MIVPPLFLTAGPGRSHRYSAHQGFSLAECILSVAIAASSLLAVVAMLTGTLGVARNSKEETVSGVLLRQLAGEMRDVPSLPPPDESNAEAEPLTILVDEAMKVLDHSRFAASNIKKAYDNGSSLTAASAFARVKRVAIPGDSLMDRIVIRIESPASAPAASRIVREYAALSPK